MSFFTEQFQPQELHALPDRQVKSIITTNSVNSMDDVVNIEGVDLRTYKKNPVVLYQHRSDEPVARAIKLTRYDDRIESVAQFPPEGEIESSDKVYALIKQGLINAVSIGFDVEEFKFLDDEMWGREFLKTTLLEYSFVSIPANAEALIIEHRKTHRRRDRLTDEELSILLGLNMIDDDGRVCVPRNVVITPEPGSEYNSTVVVEQTSQAGAVSYRFPSRELEIIEAATPQVEQAPENEGSNEDAGEESPDSTNAESQPPLDVLRRRAEIERLKAEDN